MTGFASEKREISKDKLITKEQKDELWETLVYFMKNKCMIGCSSNGGTEHNIYYNEEDTGLKSGHAYALLDVLEIHDNDCNNYHKSHRLLRIRNPWGNLYKKKIKNYYHIQNLIKKLEIFHYIHRL